MRLFRSRVMPGTLQVLLAAMLVVSAPAKSGAVDWQGVAQALPQVVSATNFTPHGTQPGLFLPLLETNPSCSSCHGANGGTSTAFRPYPSWGGSMMANATRDPVFFAALDIANVDAPGVGDYCLRCHASRGWYGGRVVKAGFGAPNNDVTLGAAGCLLSGGYDWQDTTDNDYSGLPCHYCHRLTDSGPGSAPAMIGNANAWVDDTLCDANASEPCRRGPYDYPSGSLLPPHPWKQSAYHTESGVCGVCHDVTTPDTSMGPLKTLLLDNGTDTTRPFPIERTYSEWGQSLFADAIFRDGFGDPLAGTPIVAHAQPCQICHMPTSEDPSASACSLGGYPSRTGNLPVHAFAGGNTWVPGIIKGEYSNTAAIPGAYGGVGRQASFDQTVAWARQMLGGAASIATTIQNYMPPGIGAGSMTVQVKVTNLSGHKLPTGYPEGRRMWLNLQVKDRNGALVFESGAYDAAGGVLTLDAQARVYETQQGIWNHNGTGKCDFVDGAGKPLFHFALNDCIVKDNRIPPLGFRPATAVDPNGYELRPIPLGTYPETSPGSGVLVNFDTTYYSLIVPIGTPGPLTATARLYYQTESKDYIAFVRDQAIANGSQSENAMCAASTGRPFVVGPKQRTRGEYVYELWNNAPSDPVQPGYGKSPPELMQSASAATP
ncbi:hypothetical protein [Dokdonella soli]|uniref:Cytochrome c-552/4 domain-containing protein n=1 Tax=Dokdonella soli TaxID=529810 RepID=A0ABN1ITG7_9GAMM